MGKRSKQLDPTFCISVWRKSSERAMEVKGKAFGPLGLQPVLKVQFWSFTQRPILA